MHKLGKHGPEKIKISYGFNQRTQIANTLAMDTLEHSEYLELKTMGPILLQLWRTD